MPFDDAVLPRDDRGRPAPRVARQRIMAAWLFTLAGMIVVMTGLGGATRLTGSGLSIMEWAPLSGTLPPLGHAEWERLFALYRQIPQYRLLHDGMGLAGFQQIFWLEWVHRLWGRLLGLVLLGPMAVFWWRGWMSRALKLRLVLLFALGGLQGAVGWIMVASGFAPDSTSVSAYRLVAHLALATTLYGLVVWTALGLWRGGARGGAAPLVRGLALASTALGALTIAAGGFVAGLKAGLVYNEFPRMGEGLVPPDYATLDPFTRNWFENPAAAQFDHRLLATATALATTALVAAVLVGRGAGVQRARRTVLPLAVALALQYALGVATLLWVVPVPLAVLHQCNAMLVLACALATVHGLRPARWPTRARLLHAPQSAA